MHTVLGGRGGRDASEDMFGVTPDESRAAYALTAIELRPLSATQK